ncbi:MAG: hypothetical protein KIT84_39190 [Labilithrix sp.]|nr:hypothetical protein [Labilithrix sp.]MCW5817087.1 hypothetical protein [Labilithrix sp.]
MIARTPALFCALMAGCALIPVLPSCSSYSSDDEPSADAGPDAEGGSLSIVEPPAPCDPSEVPGDGVFVSVVFGLSGAPGTASLPLSTVSDGLELAVARGVARVYLDEGTYAESLTLTERHAGILVSGGWKGSKTSWRRDCEDDFRARTTLESPAPVAVTIDVASSGATMGFEAMTITNRNLAPTPSDVSGTSSIAMLVRGSASLRISRARLLAAKGAHGGAATAGTPGATLACDGVTGCASGADGAKGNDGDGAAPAFFDPTGFHPSDGAGGQAGPPGANGTPGANGAEKSCIREVSGECNTGGGFCGGLNENRQGAKGECGCGGAGGAGGKAGRGGGASIALLALDGTVTIEHTTLFAGGGGNGSVGGKGGDGTGGSAPKAGAPTSCLTTISQSGPTGPACTCVLGNDQPAPGGAAGGPGGAGAPGSKGGDGAGGPSYGWVTLGNARVVIDDASVLNAGPGGAGSVQGASAPSLVVALDGGT